MPFKKGQSGNPAGRPRTQAKHAGAIAKAEKRIADKLPWVVDKLLELGEGVVVQEMGLTGPFIYQKPPDRDALKYLADRIMGKPTERHELTGEDGEPLFKAYEKNDSFDPDSA